MEGQALRQGVHGQFIEQILHELAVERERLKVEMDAPLRVQVLGDSNSPAAVPESPD